MKDEYTWVITRENERITGTLDELMAILNRKKPTIYNAHTCKRKIDGWEIRRIAPRYRYFVDGDVEYETHDFNLLCNVIGHGTEWSLKNLIGREYNGEEIFVDMVEI